MKSSEDLKPKNGAASYHLLTPWSFSPPAASVGLRIHLH